MISSALNINSTLVELVKKPTKTTEKLNEAGIYTIEDLLWVVPLSLQYTPPIQSFDRIEINRLFQGIGIVKSFQSRPAFRSKKTKAFLQNINIAVEDEITNQSVILQWFNAYSNTVKKLKELKEIHFLGTPTLFNGRIQVVSPQIFENHTDVSTIQSVLIQYPTINGVSPKLIESIINKVPVQIFETIEEPLNDNILKQNDLITLKEAFKIIHAKNALKTDHTDFEKAKKRMIYHEFFEEQLKLNARKQSTKRIELPPLRLEEKCINNFINSLPYQLTKDQQKTIGDIQKDLSSGHVMSRLVQGDVGSGKTVVALISAYICILNQKQVALMCPTEALALQHFNFFNMFLPKDEISLLLGSTSAKDRKIILDQLENGKIKIIIGTHSLFQKSVIFKDLSLAIIDEQHKFGVKQRMSLIEKGENVHSLILTATPIPRSLSLVQYGDLDISVIKEKPNNRKEIKTRIVTKSTLSKYLSFIKTRIELNEQIFIVVPAIEDNPDMDFKSVHTTYEEYKEYFPDLEINYIHGKLKSEERNEILNRFRKGQFNILIATSVIEVGIDIHNATVISIINPERFGLSSLHQLRGRVGRGEKPGFCFLVTDDISQESNRRLEVIESTTDGFVIAEKDLEIRGEGEVFGMEQSGSSKRRLANIVSHRNIFDMVYNDVQMLILEKNDYVQHKIEKLLKNDLITKTI